MEINKGEANKERERASKKEICYAHKHGSVLCTASPPYC
jgi:hypothetical protein